jgi:hypothetical protein
MYLALMLVLAGQAGVSPDSWCALNPIVYGNAPETFVWTVDPSVETTLNAALPPGDQLVAGDVRDMVDRVLQNITRLTRGRIRSRVVVATCAQGSHRCIQASPFGGPGCPVSAAATAVCAGIGPFFSCQATLCAIASNKFVNGTLERALTHELLHAYGLDHVDAQDNTCDDDADCAFGACLFNQGQCFVPCTTNAGCPAGTTCTNAQCGPIVCTSNAQCSSGSCIQNFCAPVACDYDSECPTAPFQQRCTVDDGPQCSDQCAEAAAQPNCGGSDGCDGEVMCGNLGCTMGSGMAVGDQKGLRSEYASSDWLERRVYTGRATSIADAVSAQYAARDSFFPPRITCTATTPGNGYPQCAMVTTYRNGGAGRLKVTTLSGSNANGSFNVVNDVLDVGFGNAGDGGLVFPPDIEIDPFGAFVYVLYTRASFGHEVWLATINLTTGEVTTTAMDMDVTLPPRISMAAPLNAFYPTPLILGYEAVTSGSGPGSPLLYRGAQDWRLKRVINGVATPLAATSNNTTITDSVSTAPVDNVERGAPAADYDFDCLASTCTLVSVNRRQGPNAGALDRMQSVRFQITSNGTGYETLGPWVTRSFNANAVIGVTLSSTQLHVAASRPVTSSNATANTRLFSHNGFDFNAPTAGDAISISDAQTCTLGTSDGVYALPSFTIHGGYSFEWCNHCAAGGRLISALMGRRSDNDAYCY